jgi:hypothetical protein
MNTILRTGMLHSISFGACAIAMLASDASVASDLAKKTAWFQMTPAIAKVLDIESTDLAEYNGVLPDLTDLSFKAAGLIVSKEDFLAMTKADAESVEIFSNVSDTKTVIHALDMEKAIELGLTDGNGLPTDAVVLLALGDLSESISTIVDKPLQKLSFTDVAAYFGSIIDDDNEDLASRVDPVIAATQTGAVNGLDHSATA